MAKVTKKTATKTPTTKTPAKKTSRKKKDEFPKGVVPKSIGACIELALLDGETDYEKILEQVRGFFPEAKTNKACVSWYATKLRRNGVNLVDHRKTKEIATVTN
jgi:hypothetical protein